MTHCRLVFAVSTALAAAILAGASPAAAGPTLRSASLPAPATGHRPGPDILYAPPAVAPQLTNAGIWRAPSILISGASAYRAGEYLYQDFLYDDDGANGGLSDPADPRRSGTANAASDAFSRPTGTYTYPTDKRYANNLADLVEFRVKPLADATAFRVTLNSLTDPALVGITIALGTAASSQPVPHGANATAAAQQFLTVHGTTADLSGGSVSAPITVAVDKLRRQFEIRVPHADWSPHGTVRLSAGVGLWDVPGDRYLIPGMSADATHPGGAGSLMSPAAFFNVAFRHAEPLPHVSDPVTTAAAPAWWRDSGQAAALAAGNLGAFFDDVDFDKLVAGVDDDMTGQPQGVPVSGPMDRILASHFETEQGADYSTLCASSSVCQGELRGRLQPYAIYVPATTAATGYGLTLLLHSLAANYNQYLGSHNQSQLGDRATGSIVITPEGRGPDGWYYDLAGADTFEVWADVASRYHLDPDLTVVTGYSMGGYATFKFGTQFPDLFALAQTTVGPPALGIWIPPLPPAGSAATSNTNAMLASLRNLPIRSWAASTDELVPVVGTVQQARTLDALGYRYVFDLFSPAEHLTLAINDEYAPIAAWLGSARVDRNPAHVTYVRNPSMDFAQDGTVADHAYWLSGITVRDPTAGSGLGTIDVRSAGFGTGDPTPSGTQVGGGVLTGGTLPAMLMAEQSQTWGAAPPAPIADRLDINATNIGRVIIDPARAHVDCNAALSITSDGPVAVQLEGCPRAVVAAAQTGAVAAPVTPGIPNTGGGRVTGFAGALGVGALLLLGRRRRRVI